MNGSTQPSYFSDVELAQPVVIFKLVADFKADKNEKKINLGVGGKYTYRLIVAYLIY